MSDEAPNMRDQQQVIDREETVWARPPPALITHYSSPITPLAVAEALTKIYRRGPEEVRALDRVSFELAAGEFAAVVGPSGAGKTTLLYMLGCMDRPTSGRLLLDG